ncbi:MAG: hypothetical protein CW691_03475 [Candidatus Bathyarchaeum sp.]|nr:MAG: hypothetical protein CW691_03475 [Candidatus Bathyarchaeum sp.]
MKKWNNIIRILGIATCLIGAYLMAFGEPIIGTDHTGIATVVGITGIGLISTGNTLSVVGQKKEEP